MLQKAMGGQRTKTRKTTVKDDHYESADQRRVRQASRPGRQSCRPRSGIDGEQRHRLPRRDRQGRRPRRTLSGGPSREGVQRDLLPLVEGTTVRRSTGR
jgi:ATP-dependent HslUV protease ATP-binding subunit HslU